MRAVYKLLRATIENMRGMRGESRACATTRLLIDAEWVTARIPVREQTYQATYLRAQSCSWRLDDMADGGVCRVGEKAKAPPTVMADGA